MWVSFCAWLLGLSFISKSFPIRGPLKPHTFAFLAVVQIRESPTRFGSAAQLSRIIGHRRAAYAAAVRRTVSFDNTSTTSLRYGCRACINKRARHQPRRLGRFPATRPHLAQHLAGRRIDHVHTRAGVAGGGHMLIVCPSRIVRDPTLHCQFHNGAAVEKGWHGDTPLRRV